jgi:hypothetical protein
MSEVTDMAKFENERSEELVERLNRHPELRDKIEALLDIATTNLVTPTRQTMLRI